MNSAQEDNPNGSRYLAHYHTDLSGFVEFVVKPPGCKPYEVAVPGSLVKAVVADLARSAAVSAAEQMSDDEALGLSRS